MMVTVAVAVVTNETFWCDTLAWIKCERAKRRGQLLAQGVNGEVRDFCEVEFELLEWRADELTCECVVQIGHALNHSERFESAGVREHVADDARIFQFLAH